MSVLANTMSRADRRTAAAYIAKENAKFSEHMELWHPRDWPEHMRAEPIQRGLYEDKGAAATAANAFRAANGFTETHGREI